MQRVVALACILLIVGMPFTAASHTDADTAEENATSVGKSAGESIIANLLNFLKGLIPRPVILFFEAFSDEENNTTSD